MKMKQVKAWFSRKLNGQVCPSRQKKSTKPKYNMRKTRTLKSSSLRSLMSGNQTITSTYSCTLTSMNFPFHEAKGPLEGLTFLVSLEPSCWQMYFRHLIAVSWGVWPTPWASNWTCQLVGRQTSELKVQSGLLQKKCMIKFTIDVRIFSLRKLITKPSLGWIDASGFTSMRVEMSTGHMLMERGLAAES